MDGAWGRFITTAQNSAAPPPSFHFISSPLNPASTTKSFYKPLHALIHHHGDPGDLDPISSPQRSISERPEHPSLHTAFSFPDVKHLWVSWKALNTLFTLIKTPENMQFRQSPSKR